jgi:hypothetical protein
VTATGIDKVYDATTGATVSWSSDKLGADAVTIAGAAAFADKNVGAGKAVNITGIGLSGADAGNYQLASSAAGTTASITPRPLDLSGNKTADGSAVFFASQVAAGGILAGDIVTLSGQALVTGAAEGLYTSLAGNALASSNQNYATSGGAVQFRIVPEPVIVSPLMPAAPAVPAAVQTLPVTAAEIVGAGLFERPRAQEANQPAGVGQQQQQRRSGNAPPLPTGSAVAAQQVPGLPLQVVDGGIRLPSGVELQQER